MSAGDGATVPFAVTEEERCAAAFLGRLGERWVPVGADMSPREGCSLGRPWSRGGLTGVLDMVGDTYSHSAHRRAMSHTFPGGILTVSDLGLDICDPL